jgi:flagellar hook-associated protein 2
MATAPSLQISWASVFGQNNTAAQMLSDISFSTFESLQTAGVDTQIADLEQQIAQIQRESQAWTLLQQDASAFVASASVAGAATAWDGMTASSGNAQVASCAADASAVAGTYDISVTALALQEIDGLPPSVALTSTSAALAPQNAAWTAATLAFSIGGQMYSVVVTASTSLASLASAINATGAPVDATVVTTASGAYLEMVGTTTDEAITYGGSTTSAAASDWEVVGLLNSSGSVAVVQAAEAAQISMGTASVVSSTNTIATLIPGVTLHLSGTGSTAITVTANPGAGQSAIETLAANWNQWVTDTFSVAWGPMPGTGASTNPYQVIRSDMPMMTLNNLADQWSSLQVDGESLGSLGISWNGQVSGQPTLSVNGASLASAVAAHPASVAAFFAALSSTAQAWANGFATGADSTTGSTLTALSTEQQQLQAAITRDNAQVRQIDAAARTQYLAWSSNLTELASEENQTNAILGALLNQNGSTSGG